MAEETKPTFKNINARYRYIQSKIAVGKNKKNEFGKFQYRYVEDIYEHLKPLLDEAELTLKIDNDLIEIGGVPFLTAVATLTSDDGETITTKSIVRVDYNLKGMSYPQMLGSCISYANKYVLGTMFLIDQNTDPDELDNSTGTQTTNKNMNQVKQVNEIDKIKNEVGKLFKENYSEELKLSINNFMQDNFNKEGLKDLNLDETYKLRELINNYIKG